MARTDSQMTYVRWARSVWWPLLASIANFAHTFRRRVKRKKVPAFSLGPTILFQTSHFFYRLKHATTAIKNSQSTNNENKLSQYAISLFCFAIFFLDGTIIRMVKRSSTTATSLFVDVGFLCHVAYLRACSEAPKVLRKTHIVVTRR
jgi:hypothetical protein